MQTHPRMADIVSTPTLGSLPAALAIVDLPAPRASVFRTYLHRLYLRVLSLLRWTTVD